MCVCVCYRPVQLYFFMPVKRGGGGTLGVGGGGISIETEHGVSHLDFLLFKK